MVELILLVALLGAGVLYAMFAKHPMSFDDLFELRFLPSRRRVGPPTYEQLGLSRDDHMGVCARKGMINSPFTNHHCECTGFEYDQDFFGVKLCKCGDEIQVHGRKR